MNEENEPKQVDTNFFNIVMSLSQTALMSMGKISNPQTGKVEKNLELAKINIDILQMLKDKTKGNLSGKENEILSDTLTNLQLTYADEAKNTEKGEKTETEKSSEKESVKTEKETSENEEKEEDKE